MTKTSKTVVFFGNERLATGVTTTAPTLQKLVEAGYTVKAVISSYTPGQSRDSRNLEIDAVAKALDIPVLLPTKLSDIADQLRAYQADIGVLVAYGKMVPQSVIDLFPTGIVNIHPSALPLHRGPTPIESVILDGSTETSVSLMKLVKAMDAGPVYAQQSVGLSGKETKQELSQMLLELGSKMLLEHLPSILNGTLEPSPQKDSDATYDDLIQKDDGLIDWHKPAHSIEREIRAYAIWPKSRTTLAGKEVVITRASVNPSSGEPGTVEATGKKLIVHCGEASLEIEYLKPAGKNEMTAEAFLAGHRHLLQ